MSRFNEKSKEELIQHIETLEKELEELKAKKSFSYAPLTFESASILKERYEELRLKNPSFSLRSLAQKVKISPGKISDIFNGRYQLSPELAKRITDNLEMPPNKRKEFLDAVANETNRVEAYRDYVKSSMDRANFNFKRTELTDHEGIEVIDHWLYIGLLAAMKIEGFDNTITWLARQLKMAESQIQPQMDKLERLGLVERNENKYFPIPQSTGFSSSKSNDIEKRKGAKKASISALRYLADDLENRTELDDVEALKRKKKNRDLCWVAAVDSTKLEEVPDFLGQTVLNSGQQIKGNPDQLYMIMLSCREIGRRPDENF
ncbi:TIGR02147 family protein [Bdellovibrio sp. KM01]|uniref:TIGR02147 family protein n=1 Tax=Bdellovibrio sp. KM01 TaxID=2748865 RepID=UPI0015EA807E|nr:TIGR02147 family protein [Bdellovibrio sp. KM01]QLY26316.1 TIGR02147 family protein [Bdellovibrio sp. KM01]